MVLVRNRGQVRLNDAWHFREIVLRNGGASSANSQIAISIENYSSSRSNTTPNLNDLDVRAGIHRATTYFKVGESARFISQKMPMAREES